MEVSLIRSDVLKTIDGGLGAFWKFVFTSVFFNADGHDLSTAGIHLDLFTGETKHIWMDLSVVVADEGALHALYGSKGASGIKPCMKCANIFNFKTVRSPVERDTTGTALYHTTHEFDKLILHTPATIDATIAKLQASRRQDLEELETRTGWNHVPNGAMIDPNFRRRIDPCSKVVYDGMHCFCERCI